MHKKLTTRVLLVFVVMSFSMALSFGCDSKKAADTMAPVIEGTSAQGISTTAATVAWTTDEDASSQVEYGVTDRYGSQTPVESTQVKTHAVALSNLIPGTTYYYSVISIDGAGNRSQSSGSTFKTVGDFTVVEVTPSFILQNVYYRLQSLSIKVKNTKEVTVSVAGGQFSLDGGNVFTFTSTQAILPGETRTLSVSTVVDGVTKGPKQLSLTLKDSQSAVLATYTATVSVS
jgi:hypothetical protein